MKVLLFLFSIAISTLNEAQLFKHGNRAYRKIKDEWNIIDYTNFIDKYPKSKHLLDVNQRLQCKKRFYAFRDLENATDSSQFISFLTTYSDCNYCSEYDLNPGRINAINNMDLTIAFVALEEIRAKAFLTHINDHSTITEVIGYQYFLLRFPQSKYISSVNDSILVRTDRSAWLEANRLETSQSFSKYLDQFPNGAFSSIATFRRDIFTRVEESLTSVNHSEILTALNSFKSIYPTHHLLDSLNNHLKELEEKPFQSCLNAKSLNKWIDFEQSYANGYYFKQANLKIRQLLKLKKNEQRSPYGSEIYVYNVDKSLLGAPTAVTVVLECKGISKRIMIKPGELTALILPNGTLHYSLLNNKKKSTVLNGTTKYIQINHVFGDEITTY
jgi:hypothetical protein